MKSFVAPSLATCHTEVDKGTEDLELFCNLALLPSVSRAERGRRHKESTEGRPARRHNLPNLHVFTRVNRVDLAKEIQLMLLQSQCSKRENILLHNVTER